MDAAGRPLLARLEGDSPIDYLHDLDANAVARFAVELIVHAPDWRSAAAALPIASA